MVSDKVVIVTGAAAGIGAEIVQQSLRGGARVIACDRDEENLRALKDSLDTSSLDIYPLDVTDYQNVVAFFDWVKQHHPNVNALVNNAGIYLGKSLLRYECDEIDRVIDVNVKGFVYGSKLFGALLLEQQRRGVIVNMSSVSGEEGSSDAVYGLSKAAILGLTKSCALNFAPFIRVNAVAPTLVDTAMMGNVPDWRKKEYRKNELLDTPVLPGDVAHTVLFLLSENARNYTGATFDLNNGCYLR